MIRVLLLALLLSACQNNSSEVEHIGTRQLPDEFSAFKIATETWEEVSTSARVRYRQPRFVNLVGIKSACRIFSDGRNPFYCPSDETVYVSPEFKRYLRAGGAIGDMPLHFVIHHEVAHDLQHKTGLLYKKSRANSDSRLTENMADCLAGYSMYYAHNNKGYMPNLSDTAEVVLALNSVGCSHSDCSHGTSEQRIKWFYEGFQDEGISNCASALSVAHIK